MITSEDRRSTNDFVRNIEDPRRYLLRKLFSENEFDGLRTLDRPLSTLFQDPGDGIGDVDFVLLLELV